MPSIQETEAFDFSALKELFSGPTLRALVGLVDVGSAFVAVIKDAAGGDPNKVHSQKRNAWTSFNDALSKHPGLGRLFVPAGILFRKPKQGETAHVLRGRKMNAPGSALVIPDGSDGATDNFLPSWFADDVGVCSDQVVHVESKKDKVVITANSGGTACSVTLNKDGSIDLTPASGKTVNVAGSTYAMPQWDDFATVLKTCTAAIKLLVAATDPATVITLANGIRTAVIALDTAMQTASNYKSQNAKNG